MTYKLHKPRNLDGAPRALLIMLHGCTQDPDDFAAGTRMNTLADAHGFIVAYPAQSTAANAMGCWNWFKEADQRRDRGEPGLIADLARGIAARQGLVGRRIFVAGLSAGGAMAVILGTTYPDVFAAVGVHSGLPYGAARSPASAFAAMRGTAPAAPVSGAAAAVPTIVFHGDCDTTVNVSNGAAIVDRAVAAAEASTPGLRKSTTLHESGGRRCTTAQYQAAPAAPAVEHWVVHGAGHAWSGGSPLGSFSDPTGPDASAQMVRFFMSHADG